MAIPGMAMMGTLMGPPVWAGDMTRCLVMPAYHQAHALLRMIESTYPAEELLHAWHVEALRRAEIAGDPAMERFTAESLRTLHDKVTAAGLARRVVMGDARPETVRLLAETVRSYAAAHARTGAALRELASRPAAARLPEVRALRQVYMYVQPAVRAIAGATRMLLGADPDPDADWDVLDVD